MSLLLLAMFCYGSVRLTKYFLRVRETRRTNAQLEELYARSMQETSEPVSTPTPAPLATETPAPVATQAPVETQAPVIYHTTVGEILPEVADLYVQNNDMVAWLGVPNVLSLPVVYRDNKYYLTHNFYGKQSDSGTLFLDVLHPLNAQTQYIMVHGHNMHDGSMFAPLTHYRRMEYIREHPYLYFTTLYDREIYEIIGVLDVTEAEMISIMRLGTPRFASEGAFNDFIAGLRAKALHFTNEEILSSDALLALSTCWEDGRIVVLFRKVEAERN